MPRPVKFRKVCMMPRADVFIPAGSQLKKERPVVMSIDEYESIRLIDYEGFSQEECGGYMKIARTTAQQIYNSARFKIASALIEGRPLRIEGGNYILCDGGEQSCGCGGCRRHRGSHINVRKGNNE